MDMNRRSSARSSVPVLMYHQILPPETSAGRQPTPYEISPAAFVEQLELLEREGFEAVSLADLVRPNGAPSTSAREVAITFDDGYVDNYEVAFPALCRLKLTATFFVIVNQIGGPGFMTWDHLREMQRAGMTIGSHTLSHLPLATLTRDDIEIEVQHSRQLLIEGLQTRIDFISFPHGSYDERVLQAVSASGYAGCCTSDFGYVPVAKRSSRIPRIIVRRAYSLDDYYRVVNGRGRRVIRMKLAAALRRIISKTVGIKNYQRFYDFYYKKTPHGSLPAHRS